MMLVLSLVPTFFVFLVLHLPFVLSIVLLKIMPVIVPPPLLPDEDHLRCWGRCAHMNAGIGSVNVHVYGGNRKINCCKNGNHTSYDNFFHSDLL